MNRIVSIIIACLVLLSVTSAIAADESISIADATDFESVVEQFMEPEDDYRGGFRYALPSADVGDPEHDGVMLDQMEAELRDFYEQGYGLIELVSSYLVPMKYGSGTGDYTDNKDSVNSDNWKTVLERVYTVCNEIGMTVQLHMGYANSGEPFVFVGEDSEGDENFRQKSLGASNALAYDGQETLVIEGTANNDAITPVSIQAIQYEVIDGEKTVLQVVQLDADAFVMEITEYVEPEEETEEATEEAVAEETTEGEEDMAAYYGMGTVEETPSHTVTFTADADVLSDTDMSEGLWDIVAYYQIIDPENYENTGSGSFACSDAPYCIVDYFSVDGALAHIESLEEEVFTEEILELIKINGAENGGGFMYDGADGHPATSDTTWSDTLPEKFEMIAGYSLLDYLCAIYSDYTLDEGELELVLNDKLETLSYMYTEYIDTMVEWAESLNSTYIHQAAYSTSLDTSSVMMHVTQPETESLNFDDSIGGYISVTAAAHMAGSDIISNEMGAMIMKAYEDDVTWLIKSINVGFLGGINQIVIHTSSHKYDSEVKWPGHNLHYTVIPDYNATKPEWIVMDDVADYITRAQYILQEGTAQRDIAVYQHQYDLGEASFKNYEELTAYGYTFDYMSPSMMEIEAAQTVENGTIDPDGGAYKAFVVDSDMVLDNTRMSVGDAEIILSYAEAGIPIILLGDAPSEVESLTDSVEDLLAVWDAIEATGNLYTATDDTLAQTLIDLDIKANAANSEPCGIASYMRATDLANYYYLYNQGTTFNYTYENEADADLSISFKGEGQPYYMDLWSGEVTAIADYTVEDGYVTINVDLEVGETCVIAIINDASATVHATNVTADAELSYNEDGDILLQAFEDGVYEVSLSDGSTVEVVAEGIAEGLTLSSGWVLEVESWTPTNGYDSESTDVDYVAATETTKTMLDAVELDELISWKEIESIGETVSGIGYYTITFELDGAYDGALIELGEVFDTALIEINGTEVKVNQDTSSADLGEYLVEGENTLVVTTPTGLCNVLLSLGAPLMSPSEPLDFGLFGPVVITPYVYLVVE